GSNPSAEQRMRARAGCRLSDGSTAPDGRCRRSRCRSARWQARPSPGRTHTSPRTKLKVSTDTLPTGVSAILQQVRRATALRKQAFDDGFARLEHLVDLFGLFSARFGKIGPAAAAAADN